jgi:hypothetical protein
MYKSICLLAFLLPIPSFASFIFSGSFNQDDNMLEYEFTIAATSTVTLESFSYGGNGSTVPAGGFAPVLSVFGLQGSDLLALLGTDDGGTAPSGCGPRTRDTSVPGGLCLDAYLPLASLNPGTYLVVLTENDNTPNGPDFAGGFAEQGNGNFTGVNQGFPGESFLDPLGNQRTPNFYFTISGADSAQALPEPSTVSLLIAGLGLLACGRKLKRGL